METQNPAACHLLHLPREIRDQIYSDVLDTAGLDPPICPTETDYCIHEDQGWGCGYYQKSFPPISCLSLLLCNRLISSEVTEMITRKNNNKKTAFRYKLDLMIWDIDLQPTWLTPRSAQICKSSRCRYPLFQIWRSAVDRSLQCACAVFTSTPSPLPY